MLDGLMPRRRWDHGSAAPGHDQPQGMHAVDRALGARQPLSRRPWPRPAAARAAGARHSQIRRRP
ncbi:hypothetical protein QJS66_02560 [Kocuria rhizophila]|nr:hypothetical protein QJS66_02560 [Kocuria rhizophila]